MQDNERMDRKNKIIIYVLCGLFALLGIAAAVYLLWEKPPAVARPDETPTATPQVTTAPAEPLPTEEPIPEEPLNTERQDGVYTVLVAGLDVGGGNTDTIMVAKLDTVAHTLDVVSIPRDTLVNVSWWVKKVNSVYSAYGEGKEGIAGLMEHVRKLIGFEPDCYAIVDLELFVQVVDAMGGVDYDVPIAMDYDIGPVIHLRPGFQHLNGEQALGLVRFRSAYVSGDLGRLDAQHDFLKAVAKQFIDLGNVPNLKKVLKLFETGLITDLEIPNIAYFVRQVLMCNSEDINFYTMPYAPVNLNEYSYVTCEIRDWFDLINAHLNPFAEPVGFGNVDIIYRDWDGTFHGTAGMRDPDYFPTAEEVWAARHPEEAEEDEGADGSVDFDDGDEPSAPEPTAEPVVDPTPEPTPELPEESEPPADEGGIPVPA